MPIEVFKSHYGSLFTHSFQNGSNHELEYEVSHGCSEIFSHTCTNFRTAIVQAARVWKHDRFVDTVTVARRWASVAQWVLAYSRS